MKNKNVSITPLPAIYYAPETRLGLGGAATFVFRLNKNDTLSRKSNIQPYFIYTQNKQILSSFGYNLFFNQENYRTEGEFAYYYFPEFYYGIGNNLPAENEELYSYRWVRIFNKTAYKVSKGVFVGGEYEYVNMYDLHYELNGNIAKTQPTGNQGGVVSGIGPAFTLDTRDNILNAAKGWYADWSFVHYASYTGSQFEYQKIKADIRHYRTVSKKYNHVLAFQYFAQFTPGNVPFKHLAQLGGDVIMRGYYAGRYRDHHFMAFQAEYRMPIWRFIGIAAFAGTGSVAATLPDFTQNQLWTSYGLGLRLRVSKKDKVNIRFDYGIGNGTSGYYINIAEAF